MSWARWHQITYIDDGMDCAQKFARRYCDEQARDLATRLRETESTSQDGPRIVSWGNADGLNPAHAQPVARVSGPAPATGGLLPELTGAHVPITPDRAHLSDLLTRLPPGTPAARGHHQRPPDTHHRPVGKPSPSR